MQNLNWWLMALAFILGFVAFLLLTVRKVTREVPVSRTVSAAVGGGAKVAAAAAAGATAAKLTAGGEEPYGSGSLRLAAGAVVPSGYTIKGNEDSMLYHTTESPWYKQTIAEVWFNAESAAQRAGFTRWDAKDKGASGVAKLADAPAGPYGKGSAKAGAGGSGPEGWTIKGNEDSMLYHTLESPWYKQTIAEVWFNEEKTAEAAGFTRWDDKGKGVKVAALADVPAGPYGKGSAKPGAGGSGPAGWLIKGNEDSMLYHPPDSPAYNETIAEVWFFDEETAKAAGFDKWDKNFK